MQTIYRLKAQEISVTFLRSLKKLFAGQEVEITIKTIEPEKKAFPNGKKRLLEMIDENRQKAPVIAPDIDIRNLIDNPQYPEQ
jgi:hypothetical protein